tara:strand:- start:4 stop:234 length:231 start_codon:yes stop_codon:yes gene_type:complete
MKLNKNDINNLIDLIDEWENAEGLGCKELNENEVGFNHKRLINFKKRLKKNESIFKKNESMFDFKKRLKKEININA